MVPLDERTSATAPSWICFTIMCIIGFASVPVQVSSFCPTNIPNLHCPQRIPAFFRETCLSQTIKGQPVAWRLFVSSSSSSSTTETGNKDNSNVVFQKVIKSPVDKAHNASPFFLGNLVEYLQDKFVLPDGLPMIYESKMSEDENNGKSSHISDDSSDKCILVWDSPMSPSTEATQMKVEVVAIFTSENGGSQQVTIPSMAMVVVRKTNGGRIPSPMMQNLFVDSEKRILRALDRGLDDFMEGKIRFDDMTSKVERKQTKSSMKEAQNAMIEELLEDAAIDPVLFPSDNDDAKDKKIPTANEKDKLKQDGAVDAEFSREDDSGTKMQKSKSQTTKHNIIASAQKAPDLDASKDFAIKAAKEIAQRQNSEKLNNSEADYAVAAAKRISTARKAQSKQIPISEKTKQPAAKSALASKSDSSGRKQRDLKGRQRVFRATFSTPKHFVAKQTQPKRIPCRSPSKDVDTTLKTANNKPLLDPRTWKPREEMATIQHTSQNTTKFKFTKNDTPLDPKKWKPREQRRDTAPLPKINHREPLLSQKKNTKGDGISKTKTEDTSARETHQVKERRLNSLNQQQAEPKTQLKSTKRKREWTAKKGESKLNINMVEDNGSDSISLAQEEELKPQAHKAKSKQTGKIVQDSNNTNVSSKIPRDEEIMKAAADVMSEIADQGIDMSPEELLQDVLKFGEMKEQESQAGNGFVSGAFEKAKELLREQKRRKDEQMATASATCLSENQDTIEPQVETRMVSSEEEELRRMFEAGERLADGRITLVRSDEEEMATTDAEEQVIDDLIAGDKSVSSHARILDDELAELEVRINQSPGEELDGPSIAKNPLFDIFSGPEVYNPNVDPETAVNWPGALPGTKSSSVENNNRLPTELTEAVKQAKFAAEVLQKLEVTDVAGSDAKVYHIGDRQLTEQMVQNLQKVVSEAVAIGIIQDPLVMMQERSRLQMVLDELWNQPEDRVRDISLEYKELLLSDNFVPLIKERLQAMAERDLDALRRRADDMDQDKELEERHSRERELLGRMVVNAQLLLREARALGAELEAQQIEVIRSICKVAMDPTYTTEEETATALSDAVRDMRPLFDDMFIAYLKYAVEEEEGRLARAGLLDDPGHNQWLFVLKIVQQGVHAEVAKGINRYLEHIWYVLRMETAVERKMLLEKLIDAMPTLDVRPFVQVVDNIVGGLGDAARGEMDAEGAHELGKMTNKLLQLRRDVKELLPPERIDRMSRDADEWAAKQKKKLLEERKLTKQRLKAGRETEKFDNEIEALGRQGEIDRFD